MNQLNYQVPRFRRRGITILEVLIAIGILSIGLASVVALVPAGQSQAARAVVLDRASLLAANVLADVATFGALRPTGVSSGTSRPLVIDSIATNLSGAAIGGVGSLGVYANAAPTSSPAVAYQNMFLQLRDDITFRAPATPDDPPTNVFLDGSRSFEGRMSALLCLQSGTPAGPDRISVVVFHRRDRSFPTLSATLTSGTLVVPTSQSALLGSRLVPDVIKPGVVVCTLPGPRFHQIVSARIDTLSPVSAATQGSYNASLTFSTGVSITTGTTPVPLIFLPDSVGLAERPFVPETAGAYTQ